MIPIKRADRITQVADMVMKTEAALGELHHYHRLGRHLSLFPQKPYFLFSHCAHLVFSLWREEQDSPVKVFTASPGLTALFTKMDFGALRYLDYGRRMLHANACEEHLRNEPKWFRFWVKLLQELQGSEAGTFEEFYQQFFACLDDCSVLEGRLTRGDQKALTGLVQGPRAGRLLLHSTWVLEDVISTASSHIARLDPASHAIEQMQILVCLLSQLRRAILLEAAAEGPYRLSSGCGWDAPSTLGRLFARKTPGLLTVTPGDGNGEITCTYTGNGDSKGQERTWTRSIAALPCAYEELLFKTWSPHPPEQSPNDETAARARWIVQAVEADHLETISNQADKLLERFGRYPAHGSLVETAAHILRNGRRQWTATELPWGYVRTLDQFMNKLKFACREANVLGGEHPAAKVVANLWPPRSTPSQETGTAARQEPAPQPVAMEEAQVRPVDAPERAEDETAVLAADSRATGRDVPPAPADPGAGGPEPQTDLSEEPEPISLESLLEPQCFKGRDHASRRPIACGQDDGSRPHTGPNPAADGGPQDVADRPATQSLVWRMMEWHRPTTEGNEHQPLSVTQLQNDLGWTQARVLQTMSNLFGSKPFTRYRRKCTDKSIRRFLEDFSANLKERSKSTAQTLYSSAG